MKRLTWILPALLATTLLFTGCGGSAKVDASSVEKSFSSAEPGLKATADKVVAALQGQNYSGALADLQKLATNVKLTDEQKKSVQDVLAQVQKALGDTVTKATGEAGKALDDVQKALPK